MSCRFASTVILEIAYGRRIDRVDDPYMEITKEMADTADGTGEPGSSIIDFFPICEASALRVSMVIT